MGVINGESVSISINLTQNGGAFGLDWASSPQIDPLWRAYITYLVDWSGE
jgi:hypothetical protein